MNQAKTAIVLTGLSTCLMIGGCTIAPKASSDAAAVKNLTSVCEDQCEDDDANRYQYYLGILSVFLMG